MGSTFVIKTYPSNKNIFVIDEQTAEKYGLTKKKHGYVSFGTQRKFVDIYISHETMDGEILLSDNVIEYLHVPAFPSFELKTKGNEIIIGPCIGILANRKDEKITKRRLKKISMSTLDYPEIHGAVIVFALDKVDTSNRLVEGYCYNHREKLWERGVFPYPSSLCKRTGMDDEMQDHFLSAIGDTIFNNYYFNKWMMYQWFSNEKEIVNYLPDTIMYTSYRDILDMLEKYKKVYIKPIQGMKGFGVVKVSMEGGKTVFRYRKDDDNKEIASDNIGEINRVSEKLFKPDRYIIQQGLNLISYNGKVVDFRCVMQKDGRGRWVCNGIVARTGAKESIVSNISSGGMAYPASELIKEALLLPQDEIFALKEQMVSLCTKICYTLDEYGINYGTLGLDIGIDEQKRLWIIEINNRYPHPAIALRANDLPSYYTILASPLHYAKRLAGF